MNTRIFNARILTMKDGCEVFEGEIQIQGNKITRIVRTDLEVKEQSCDQDDIKWDRQIDADGNVIMPGFKDAHTHSGMTFLRSYADDLPLEQWLYNKVFPLEGKLKNYPDELYFCNILANMEYLTSGITSNMDMYLNNEVTAKASKDMGYRTVMVDSINNFGGTIEGVEEDFLKYNEYDPLISYCLGFHAEYTTSPELMEGIRDLSHKYHSPVYLHLAETRSEVDGCIERYGVTPTVYLNNMGMFDYGGGGYHCVHMTDEDLNIFKEKKLWAITNPGSNVKLASGIPPIQKMLDMGINLAIGTDGPASNNCLDMFREMFLTTALQKVSIPDASATDAFEVLKMATVGGAHAMCLEDCDILEEGKYADLIMIDINMPNMQPLNNIPKNLVYSGSKQNIKMTMINGKILYEDGKFDIGYDPTTVYENVNNLIRSIEDD